MSNIVLPYPTPDWIYEGTDGSQFEDVTGIVTNRAPKQIQLNAQYLGDELGSLQDVVAGLITGTGAGIPINSEILAWNASTTYAKYQLCANLSPSSGNGRVVYISLVDNNLNNALPGTPDTPGASNAFWEAVQLNIFQDLITTVVSSWSSSKIKTYVDNSVANIDIVGVIDGGNASTVYPS